MLTGKQKRYLRSEAHHLNAIFQVGKESINDNQVKIIENMNNERMVNMNIQMLNAISGSIMSPM